MTEQVRLRSEALSWREIDAEVVAVDISTSTYLSANPAGAILWQMLATGATRAALADRLVETFGIDRERAEADVAAFVDSLATRGLLEQ